MTQRTFERVIGVAFKHRDGGVYALPAPARHGQVSRLVDSCYPEQELANLSCEQGFVTNHARFVSRVEAWTLVSEEMRETKAQFYPHYPRLDVYYVDGLACPNNRGEELYSEDLW